MNAEERSSLMKMFAGVSKEITKERNVTSVNDDGVPDGITKRLKKLKENYLKK